jgi:MYXO-CTERM domain-containing protein
MIRRPFVLAGVALVVGFLAGPSSAATPTPAQLRQLDLASHPAVKLLVRQTGWVRVTQPELLAAGLDPKVDVRALQLFADGVEQPLQLTGNGDTVFDADEAIEFYAEGRDTLWTDTRTYWLVSGTAGLRVPLVAYASGRAPPASFRQTEAERGHSMYYAALLNGDESNFFTAAIGTTVFNQTVTTRHPAAPANAVLRLFLQGATTGDHLLPVALNGTSVGTCAFTGQVSYTCALPIPELADGDNQVTLSAQGAAPDLSVLGTVSIEYDHPYTADQDALMLTAPSGTRLTLDGFSSADVRVLDLTNPAMPVELVVSATFNGVSFAASLDTPGDTMDHVLYAFTEAGVGRPFSVAASRPSTLSQPQDGGSEVVILSHAAFLAAAQALAQRRRQEGWTVAVIDLQDVYDEFGGGDKTAFAIRDFLQYAHEGWRIPPGFVLLVGDASFDPRNFLGQGDFDFAPTKLIDTQEMETASDDWFVDWNDDGIPELAMGRLSVRTSDEATRVVNKILGYAGTDDLPRGGLFVADLNSDGLDFEQTSQLSAAAVADIMPVDRYFRSQPGSTAAGLVAKLNSGTFLVNYIGHGSVEVWDGTLTGADATALTNQHLSIYVSMNCLNGFFQDVYTESLAETLQKAPAGGAVAVWASSALTSFDSQAVLNQEFLKRLTRTSLGEAAMAAKAADGDLDTQRTWILFGDPTLFGKPRMPASDAGATDGAPEAGNTDGPPEAGGSLDGGAVDAASDGASSSADGGPGGTDSSRDAGPDAPGKPPAGGGCGCQIMSAPPALSVTLTALLVAMLVPRRRRRQKRPGPGTSCLKFCRQSSDIRG